MSDFGDEIKLRGEGFVTPQVLCTVKSCIIMNNLIKKRFSHNYKTYLRQFCTNFNGKT